jgi:hypothetical protein
VNNLDIFNETTVNDYYDNDSANIVYLVSSVFSTIRLRTVVSEPTRNWNVN